MRASSLSQTPLWEAENKDSKVSDGVGAGVQELGWSKHLLWNVSGSGRARFRLGPQPEEVLFLRALNPLALPK